jgi:hypothetical protein
VALKMPRPDFENMRVPLELMFPIENLLIMIIPGAILWLLMLVRLMFKVRLDART